MSLNNLIIKNFMIKLEDSPTVHSSQILKEVIDQMDNYNLGIVCIIDDDNNLKGVITDGDLRRVLNSSSKDRDLNKLIRNYPLVINENMSASKALAIMNDKKITSLLVVSDKDKNKKDKVLKGIIHIHFLLKNGIK